MKRMGCVQCCHCRDVPELQWPPQCTPLDCRSFLFDSIFVSMNLYICYKSPTIQRRMKQSLKWWTVLKWWARITVNFPWERRAPERAKLPGYLNPCHTKYILRNTKMFFFFFFFFFFGGGGYYLFTAPPKTGLCFTLLAYLVTEHSSWHISSQNILVPAPNEWNDF